MSDTNAYRERRRITHSVNLDNQSGIVKQELKTSYEYEHDQSTTTRRRTDAQFCSSSTDVLVGDAFAGEGDALEMARQLTR